MNSSERLPVIDEGGMDLIALSGLLWRYRLSIALMAIGCGLIALILAVIATPIYRAEVIIAEVHEGDVTGGESIANQLGGLASLAGVNLGGSERGKRFQAVLKSRHLVEDFIKRGNLLPVLHTDSESPPTLWLTVRRFRKNVLSFSDDKRTETTTVAIEWTDPVTSAQWANGFVTLANETIRAQVMEESRRSIAYLTEQVSQTNIVELQRVMYNIIAIETKKLMLANARAEYAFAVVDPAVPPEIRTSPKRALMVLFGTALGLLLGIISVLTRDLVVRRRQRVKIDNLA